MPDPTDNAKLVERLRIEADIWEPPGYTYRSPTALVLRDASTALASANALNERLREVTKVSLAVLHAARDGQTWHENMLKDFDCAINGCRALLADMGKGDRG